MRNLRSEDDWAARAPGGRGFTLVEALLAAGILVILAAVAVHGVRRYLAFAKSAEAIQMVGAIGRAVAVSADRLQADTALRPGSSTTTSAPVLCTDSTTVPASFSHVRARKYQPNARQGMDYNTGTTTGGWHCLAFENTNPQSYQYRYRIGGSPIAIGLRAPAGVPLDRRWAAYARGDLDGDDKIAWFVLEGYTRDGRVVTASRVAILDQDE